LCALIELVCPKPGNDRPPVGVERMLRIYLLQQLPHLLPSPHAMNFGGFSPALYEAVGQAGLVRLANGRGLARDRV
jgi:hypothetical protein